MKIFYTLGIYLFRFVLLLISPFHIKVRKGIAGRRKTFSAIESAAFSDDVVWMHCASLGEYEQGLPVYNALKMEYPEKKFIVSFFSPSGFEIASKKSNDFMFYLPLDTPANMKKLVEMINPELVIFVKYEFWFNLLQELEKKQSPHILISGVLRSSQLFFKPYGNWFLERLKNFTFLFLQNQESLNLLMERKISHATVSGDTRFNKVQENAQKPEKIPFIQEYLEDNICMVAGSTWQKDHGLLIEYCQKDMPPNAKWIIAPHEINPSGIESLQIELENALLANPKIKEPKVLRWSEIQKHSNQLNQYTVLIIDTIGILSQLYQYADVCYVGGAFRKKRGLHNILEPAAFGKALFFGPHYKDFHEAEAMISLEAAYSVFDYSSFQVLIERFISDKNFRENTGANAREFVFSRVNSSSIILETIDYNKWIKKN